MSSGRVPARITPAVLAWARHSARLEIAVAADKADVKEKALAEWESGIAQPSLSRLRKLAQVYKRPLLVFYLNERPNASAMSVSA
jgi:transcriptional regulator with XRE-family HTH domain